jgi:hypothetical protein
MGNPLLPRGGSGVVSFGEIVILEAVPKWALRRRPDRCQTLPIYPSARLMGGLGRVEGAGWLVHLAKSGMSGSLLELKNSPALGLVWKIEQGNWQKLWQRVFQEGIISFPEGPSGISRLPFLRFLGNRLPFGKDVTL